MQTLPIETIAIVEATAPDVQASTAAIAFRMWHDLPTGAQRLLFAQFALRGDTLGLIEAIVAAARGGRAEILPRLLTALDRRATGALYDEMEPILAFALGEALGKRGTETVLDAWRQAFRFLTRYQGI